MHNGLVQGSELGWQENRSDTNCDNPTFRIVTYTYTLYLTYTLVRKIETFFFLILILNMNIIFINQIP